MSDNTAWSTLLVLSTNLIALTVLLVGFAHKVSQKSRVPSLIAQYRIFTQAQAKAIAPLLILTELGVVVLGLWFMAQGQWGAASALLLATYLAYLGLLFVTKVRAIPVKNCGCSLSGHSEDSNLVAIVIRNSLLVVLLVLAWALSGSVSLDTSSIVLALLVSVLFVVALTGFEALMINAEKLKGLKVYHG